MTKQTINSRRYLITLMLHCWLMYMSRATVSSLRVSSRDPKAHIQSQEAITLLDPIDDMHGRQTFVHRD